MIKFWFTVFLMISSFYLSFANYSRPLYTNRPDSVLVKSDQPQISDFTYVIIDNEVILSWTLKVAGEITNILIDKMAGQEILTIGEIKYDNNSLLKEFTFPDKTTPDELKEEKIIYRLRGMDSTGLMLIEKKLAVEIDKVFEGYELFQNYPNPFNPVTTLKFRIPVQKHVTIKIFNILGNAISTLVDETKSPGIYEVEFDGSALTSGVYLFSIQAGEYSETKRMILMK